MWCVPERARRRDEAACQFGNHVLDCGDVGMELCKRRLEDHPGEEAGVTAAGAHRHQAAHRVAVEEAGEAAKLRTNLRSADPCTLNISRTRI